MTNIKKYKGNPIALAVAVSLLFVPITTFAKTNNGNNGKGNQNQVQSNGCPTKAYGHLFAPGWWKRNSTTPTVPIGCLLPPGIAKKLGLTPPVTGTTTDTVAPTISSIVVTPATTTATVTWNTNEAADSAVFFSTSLPVNTSATATQVVSSDLKITSHSLQLTNLSTSTTYFAVVRSRDAAGNTTTSPVSFTTGSGADVTSPTMTNLVAVVGTSTLRFTWNTNEPATSKVFYSTTTPVNINSTSTPFVENLSLVNAHDITLTGLSTSTLYRIVVQSKDIAANASIFAEFPVTTSP